MTPDDFAASAPMWTAKIQELLEFVRFFGHSVTFSMHSTSLLRKLVECLSSNSGSQVIAHFSQRQPTLHQQHNQL